MSILTSWELWAALSGLFLAACYLTRGIDLDDLQASLDRVNGYFVYEGATGFERWRVLDEGETGDCEDYALSVIAGLRGPFLWNVCNPFKFRLWAVTDPNGAAHMIAVCHHGAFDNHRKRLTDPATYKTRGYKFRFWWPAPMILMKLAIGKI